MPTIPLNLALTPELEVAKLGGQIKGDDLFAQVADSPIGFRLRDVFEHLGKPDQLAPFKKLYKRFEVWMIPHRISILRREGFAEPTSVGMMIEYENEDRTCMVASLLPSFQYITHGEARLKGTINAGGEVAAGGVVGKEAVPLVERAGIRFAANSEAGLSFEMQSTVCTPIVAAAGVGARRCEWRFDKHKEPLFGRDIETWAAVVLPKGQEELTYRASFYVCSRVLLVTTRRESHPITIRCTLSA
mgnify:CR=1 FL=1|jgi:hypothetical protein